MKKARLILSVGLSEKRPAGKILITVAAAKKNGPGPLGLEPFEKRPAGKILITVAAAKKMARVL